MCDTNEANTLFKPHEKQYLKSNYNADLENTNYYHHNKNNGETQLKICSVCWKFENQVQIITCNCCNNSCHTYCYGKHQQPFTCNACEYSTKVGMNVNQLTCALCLEHGGMLKCGSERLWVHINCILLSNHGPIFQDYLTLTNPINIQRSVINHNMLHNSCYICNKMHGLTSKCLKSNCRKRMHVTCAHFAKLNPYFKILNNNRLDMNNGANQYYYNNSNTDQLYLFKFFYCDQHYNNQLGCEGEIVPLNSTANITNANSVNAMNAQNNIPIMNNVNNLNSINTMNNMNNVNNANNVNVMSNMNNLNTMTNVNSMNNLNSMSNINSINNLNAGAKQLDQIYQSKQHMMNMYQGYNNVFLKQPNINYNRVNSQQPMMYIRQEGSMNRMKEIITPLNNAMMQNRIQPMNGYYNYPNVHNYQVKFPLYQILRNNSTIQNQAKVKQMMVQNHDYMINLNGTQVVKQVPSMNNYAQQINHSNPMQMLNNSVRIKQMAQPVHYNKVISPGDDLWRQNMVTRDKNQYNNQNGKLYRWKNNATSYMNFPSLNVVPKLLEPWKKMSNKFYSDDNKAKIRNYTEDQQSTRQKNMSYYTAHINQPNQSVEQQKNYESLSGAATQPAQDDARRKKSVRKSTGNIGKAIYSKVNRDNIKLKSQGVRSSRTKTEEEYLVGSALCTRGQRFNWQKLEAYLESISNPNIINAINNMQSSLHISLHSIVRFGWIFDDPMLIIYYFFIADSELYDDNLRTGLVMHKFSEIDDPKNVQLYIKPSYLYIIQGDKLITAYPLTLNQTQIIQEMYNNKEDISLQNIKEKIKTMNNYNILDKLYGIMNCFDRTKEITDKYCSGNKTLDITSWIEIQKLESILLPVVYKKHFSIPYNSASNHYGQYDQVQQHEEINLAYMFNFFILLKRISTEITAAKGTNYFHTAVVKFLSDQENTTDQLQPSLLRKTASTTKKMFLYGYFWDLNPTSPIIDSFIRPLFPIGSYTINENTSLNASQEQDFNTTKSTHDGITTTDSQNYPKIIPTNDEITRDWLTSAQKVRVFFSHQIAGSSNNLNVSQKDFSKASKGEDFVKILASDEYWRVLLFSDNFARRQTVCLIMLWAKKRAKLTNILNKMRKCVEKDLEETKNFALNDKLLTDINNEAFSSYRWSMLRESFENGHQDPLLIMIERVKAEANMEYTEKLPVIGDAYAPGAISEKLYFCSVCFGPDSDSLDPLTKCARCDLRLHKNCYAIGQQGLLDLDTYNWLCDRCLLDGNLSKGRGDTQKKPKSCALIYCAICLQRGGAMRRLIDIDGRSNEHCFAHITCVIWVMPIININNLAKLKDFQINYTFQQLKEQNYISPCYYCACKQYGNNKNMDINAIYEIEQEKILHEFTVKQTEPTAQAVFSHYGITVQCNMENCEARMHPLCAWLSGCLIRVYTSFHDLIKFTPTLIFPKLNVEFFCPIHTELNENRINLNDISEHRIAAYHNHPILDLYTIDQVLNTDYNELTEAKDLQAKLDESKNLSVNDRRKRNKPYESVEDTEDDFEDSKELINNKRTRATRINRDISKAVNKKNATHCTPSKVANSDTNFENTQISQEMLILTATVDSIENTKSQDLDEYTNFINSTTDDISNYHLVNDIYRDKICMVCLSKVEKDNQLICNICSKVTIHESCKSVGIDDKNYNIMINETCSECQNKIYCQFCPRIGGAYITVNQLLYHYICCSFDFKLANITNSKNQTSEEIYLSSASVCCSICFIKYGKQYKCTEANCVNYVHGSCAVLADCLINDKSLICLEHKSSLGALSVKFRNYFNQIQKTAADLLNVTKNYLTLLDKQFCSKTPQQRSGKLIKRTEAIRKGEAESLKQLLIEHKVVENDTKHNKKIYMHSDNKNSKNITTSSKEKTNIKQNKRKKVKIRNKRK